MEGNHCRKLTRSADEAMDSIELPLTQVPLAQRALGCDDAEIQSAVVLSRGCSNAWTFFLIAAANHAVLQKTPRLTTSRSWHRRWMTCGASFLRTFLPRSMVGGTFVNV